MRLKKRLRRYLWQSSPDALRRRYIVALAIIFMVISISHATALGVLRAGSHYADLLDASGRMPMLSQRIMYFVHELSLDENETTKNQLNSAIRFFEGSHEFLVSHPDLPQSVKDFYETEGSIPLDTFSRRFAAMASYYMYSSGEEQFNIQRQIATWGERDLLIALNEANRLIKTEAEAHEKKMRTITKVAFAVALLVILMEALFIFLPAQIAVRRAFERLNKRSDLLMTSLQKLKVRNSQLQAARRDLDHAANHDALTGLLNRRALLAGLSETLEDQQRDGGFVGLLKVDLDYFKTINDTHGHRAGDAVLTTVANRLTETFGGKGLIARVGGDEFIVVVTFARSLDALESRAGQLVQRISEPMKTEEALCRVGASIGITMTGAQSATRDQLFVEADLALYAAKRQGRGRVYCYSDELHDQISSKRALLGEITEALKKGQFEAFLQPQIDVHTGELHGCEMLARWRHPDHGIVTPAGFLDAAREAGLLREIDLAVTAHALDLLEALQADGMMIPQVSVNACAETLRDPHYADWVQQELKTRLLKPEHIVIEILESTLIEGHNDLVLQTVLNLSTVGIAVMLDDFGTGYATMATLSQLQLSGLKIDRSLIDPLPAERASSIVAALVALSRSLDMQVIAEGVETECQMMAVRDLGCDVVQGFGIARPMDFEGFRLWYASLTQTPDAAVSF